MDIPPLNGQKTHPLTPHATERLRQLLRGPIPANEINAGVINRFMREDLAELVMLPSPYKSHKGSNTNHVQITDKGRTYLASLA